MVKTKDVCSECGAEVSNSFAWVTARGATTAYKCGKLILTNFLSTWEHRPCGNKKESDKENLR